MYTVNTFHTLQMFDGIRLFSIIVLSTIAEGSHFTYIHISSSPLISNLLLLSIIVIYYYYLLLSNLLLLSNFILSSTFRYFHPNVQEYLYFHLREYLHVLFNFETLKNKIYYMLLFKKITALTMNR